MRLSLARDEAHLFYLIPEEIQDLAQLMRYRSWMSAEECARCDRYVFPHSRKEYLLTRALVRGTLSLYADVAPADWRFHISSHGRPTLAGPLNVDVEGLRFNVSNTAGLIALLIVQDREVGIDVEDITRKGQTVEIADQFFSANETAALRALPVSEQRARFFSYWTLKEAYIKARGLGLSIPLDQFSFALDSVSEEIRIEIDAQLKDDAARWQFAQLRLSERHACAAAVSLLDGRKVTFVVRQTIPDLDGSSLEKRLHFAK